MPIQFDIWPENGLTSGMLEVVRMALTANDDGLTIETEKRMLATIDHLVQTLRQEWWANHGCNPAARYGDDGKMDCNQCFTDFRNTPIEKLAERVFLNRLKKWQAVMKEHEQANQTT